MSKRSARRNKYRQQHNEREGEKRLDTMEVKALDAVSEIVERKVGVDESRQPRFTTAAGVFSSIYRWAVMGMANEPGLRATMRQWDTWYRDFCLREPFLVGVFNSACQIDQNRGWTLTGGRNQVNRYTKVFHDLDNGEGWRTFISWQAQSYYSTQMGFVSEVGRQGKAGPMLTLWSVDPCQCELSGDPDAPLWYYPRSGGKQEWTPDFYFRGKSLVRTSEQRLMYGYPAVARCYDLAKIMVGIYSHYQQKVGTKTPDGILTGANISESQWEEAIRARNESLLASPDSYLDSIATIMSSGTDIPSFVLTTLSSLPDRWDFDIWTQILMRGYALAFGYQSSEFYPENAGVMGRGKEQEIQHESATGKGGKDFSLTMQEKLQAQLPPTLEFQFDERDTTGEIEDAQLQLAKAQVISALSALTEKQGGIETSRLTTDQILQLAAEQGVIPEDWTPQTEDVTSTDEEEAEKSDEIMSERIYRAMRSFPDEPIVRYSWPSDKTRIIRTARRRSFYLPKVISRSVESVAATYGEQLQAIADDAANGASQDEIAKRHRELIVATAILAYVAGMQAGGVSGDEMTDAEKLVLAGWTTEQLSHVDDFAAAAVAAGQDPAERDKIVARVELWIAALIALGGMGRMAAQSDMAGTWRLGETEQHCRTCAGLHGKRHRLSWYKARGLIPREPGSTTLECRGFRCDCHIYSDKGDVLL